MSNPDAFVTYLERLADDRGALAALRRGLGRPPGEDVAAYRYVVPWLHADAPRRMEAAYYTVAALFALHPEPGGSGNLGDNYAVARDKRLRDGGDDKAIERRFAALLNSHADDLPGVLRHAISYLASQEIPVDWHQLLWDTMAWGYPGRDVQREWARSYWGQTSAPEPDMKRYGIVSNELTSSFGLF